jgi:DHA1 family bicyclomycin/chloramphenicol resistance-like MFS transporter
MLRPGTFALTLLLAALTTIGPLSIDMYLPSLPEIGRALAAPIAQVQLTISSYLIGFAAGQIVYGPLSDRYGRRPVLFAALAVYVVGTGICAGAQSIGPLIAGRFFQGVGGAGSNVLARAIVRDLYSGVRAARELSLMGSIMAFAPIVAPMIGGVLQTQFGWRANFILMVVAAVIVFAVASQLLPETLRQRSTEAFSLKWLGKGYLSLLRHRSFVAYLGILTIGYAGLFAWISAAAVVLEGIYGMSAVTFGFTFALGAAGFMAGAAGAARLVQRFGIDRMMGLGGSLLAVGGTGFALIVALQIPNGLWLIVMMAIYLAGLGLAMPQAMAGALTPFPERAGMAASLLGVVQQSAAAAAAATIGAYLGPSARPVAGAVLAAGWLTFLVWAFTRSIRGREASNHS